MAIIRDGKHLLITDGFDVRLKTALANIKLAMLRDGLKKKRQEIFDLLFDAVEDIEHFIEKDECKEINARVLAQFKKDIKW